MPDKEGMNRRIKETMAEDKFGRFWDRGDAERYYLHDVEFITVGFIDGTSVVGKLIEYGKYVIVVLTKSEKREVAKTIIYKNSIKYIIPMEAK